MSKTVTYETLNGLRGLAAASVVLLHAHNFMESSWYPRGAYLAVDVFFMMSGFVLSAAYATRLDGGLSFETFMRKRIVRLWPLHMFAVLLSSAMMVMKIVLSMAVSFPFLAILLGVFFLPLPGSQGELFLFNPPVWSLFYELLANAILCLCWRHLTRRVLLVVVAMSAFGLVVSSFAYGSLDAGFSVATIPAAVSRVGFSFFLGVLLWKLDLKPLRFSAWIPISLLAVVLLLDLPQFPRAAIDAVLATTVVPLIVVFGVTTQPKEYLASLCRFGGDVSYALYILNAPLIGPAIFLYEKVSKGGGAPFPAWWGLALLSVLLAFAWMLDKADVRLRPKIDVLAMEGAAAIRGIRKVAGFNV